MSPKTGIWQSVYSAVKAQYSPEQAGSMMEGLLIASMEAQEVILRVLSQCAGSQPQGPISPSEISK